jgi:opacity protein-like surface antigen
MQLNQYYLINPLNSMNMKSRLVIVILLLCFATISNAQWETDLGAGVALPITGYKEVLKTGWFLNGEGRYRFAKGNFAVGMKVHYTRLQKDKNPSDAFQNARMTVVPIVFTAEYALSTKGKVQPYLTGGLGISLFNFNYEISPGDGKTVFNVSFSMMPQVGLRYAASAHLYPFIEYGWMLLADGPPVGFPQGEKLTGYNAAAAGVSYRFGK